MIDRIQWLGHGSFVIQGPPIIYINPWRIARNSFPADVILVSHHHYDHCSLADIEKLRGAKTILIGNEHVSKEIEGCAILRPWQSLTIDRASVKAVPAYSTKNYRHPQEEGGLGFVISMNYYDIYYAGDTEIIPEMSRIQPDIAILPIDGNGTMNVAEAVDVVKLLHPRWVFPSNWGSTTEGATRLDAQTFEREASQYSQVVMPQIAVR